jgi:hypothetical protein
MKSLCFTALSSLVLLASCSEPAELPRPPIPDELLNPSDDWPFGKTANDFESDNDETVKFGFRDQFPKIRLNQMDSTTPENAVKVREYLAQYFAKLGWKQIKLPPALAKTDMIAWADDGRVFTVQTKKPEGSFGLVLILYYAQGFSNIRSSRSDQQASK